MEFVSRPGSAVQAKRSLDEFRNQGSVSRERALLAVRLSALRVDRGWNWATLARHAGINARQVEEIEAAERDPSFTTLVRLANALAVHSLDEFLAPPVLHTALGESRVTAGDSIGHGSAFA